MPIDKKALRTGEEKGMNLARQQSMKTFEDLYAEPPPYSSQPSSAQVSTSSADAGGSLPAAEELNFQPSPLEIPTPAECIAHLKLLHAFAKLRHNIGNFEGLFGINSESADASGTLSSQLQELALDGSQHFGGKHEDITQPAVEEQTDATAAALAERIRDKRWSVFVAKAVDRYEKWWDTHSNVSSEWYSSIKKSDFEAPTYGYLDDKPRISRFTTDGDGYESRLDFRLPPLDVLMVWHAHMLNPRTYLEDCVRFTSHRLWRTAFSWHTIYEMINSETFKYHQEDETRFKRLTGCEWDPLKNNDLKKIKCPKCTTTNKVPWTVPPVNPVPEALEEYLKNDVGFTGSAFQHTCLSCGFEITHEKLHVGKFCDDAESLITLDRPLAGTILNIWGEPAGTTKGKKLSTHDAFFPNRTIEGRTDLQPAALRSNMQHITIESIKNTFERLMKSKWEIALINSEQKRPDFIAKSSRIAVRKVLSHYWDNSSIFGIDLAGAVLRQGSFVQKMVKLDWLRSPGLMKTAQRLIVKYHRFVRLAAENPGKMVVPTLDVDLAWHTHQLTPRMYYRYTLAETKKFLNHDDKVPESNLHTSFQWTSQAYEKKYGQPYSECSCWYCECTREPLRSNFMSKLSSRRASLSVEKLDGKGFTKDVMSGPHLSAHNAFPVSSDKTPGQRRKELEDLDLQYAKVLKRYQKQKQSAQAPRKDTNDPYYGAYGYPMMYPMPIYIPYSADPSCEAHAGGGGGGGTGGCVAATCCDSASLGACAGGDGTPGCAASCGGHGEAGGGCGTGGSGGDGGGGGGGGDGGGGGGGGCGGGGG